jgi:hypothetical protein
MAATNEHLTQILNTTIFNDFYNPVRHLSHTDIYTLQHLILQKTPTSNNLKFHLNQKIILFNIISSNHEINTCMKCHSINQLILLIDKLTIGTIRILDILIKEVIKDKSPQIQQKFDYIRSLINNRIYKQMAIDFILA